MHPGWTGLNFNLSTLFAVTRIIKDGPDESPNQGSLAQRGFLNIPAAPAVPNYAKLNSTTWNTTTYMTALADDSRDDDLEPDEYSFSIPGLSGKFYYGHDNKWKIRCDRPVKVEGIGTTVNVFPPGQGPPNGTFWQTVNGNYMAQLQGFIVTDEFGTKYEFGGGSNAYMEYSMDFFNQKNDTWVCNAWYLKSITRHTGQVINFTYERGAYVAQMNFSVNNTRTNVNGAGFLNQGCSSSTSILSPYGEYRGKLVWPIYLTEISGDNFKVKFESTTSTELRYDESIFSTYINAWDADPNNVGSRIDILTILYDCLPSSCIEDNRALSLLLNKLQWRKLDRIKIQDGTATTIKEFEFTYNNVDTERLMLQKVQEKSGYNTKKIPPYEFIYFSDPTLSLPAYGKSHTDHWGFNNGKIINIATDFNSVATYGATYRIPPTDKRLYRLGSLKQVNYPTGGITKYFFEPHTYAKEVKLTRWTGLDPFTTNQVAGGLRIKEIHSYDPNAPSPTVIKKYYYVTGFNPASPDTTSLLSSGVLGGKAQYWWPNYQPVPQGSFTFTQQVFSTQSVLPATENSMGSHVGYTQVVENSSTGGWTVHTFTNFDYGTNATNGYLDDAPSG